jgi:hypothetical protein
MGGGGSPSSPGVFAAFWRAFRKAWRISPCIRRSPGSIELARRSRQKRDARRWTSSSSTGVCGRSSKTIAASKARYSSRCKWLDHRLGRDAVSEGSRTAQEHGPEDCGRKTPVPPNSFASICRRDVMGRPTRQGLQRNSALISSPEGELLGEAHAVRLGGLRAAREAGLTSSDELCDKTPTYSDQGQI